MGAAFTAPSAADLAAMTPQREVNDHRQSRWLDEGPPRGHPGATHSCCPAALTLQTNPGTAAGMRCRLERRRDRRALESLPLAAQSQGPTYRVASTIGKPARSERPIKTVSEW